MVLICLLGAFRMAEMSYASDMRPMAASHGPNSAFVARPSMPTRFQPKKVRCFCLRVDSGILEREVSKGCVGGIH